MTGSVPPCPFSVLATWERDTVVLCPLMKGMRWPNPRKMLQRNKVCTLFFEEEPGVETTLAAQEGVGQGDGFPFQVSELATDQRGHFESSLEDRRGAAGRAAGWGAEPELGRPREPPPCAPLRLLSVLVLGHQQHRRLWGRAVGGRRPPVPSLPFRIKGQEGRMTKCRQTCP